MECYLTWDISGEYLWLTTPYKNRKTHKWESEHETPQNKIPVKKGTLEFYCWDAVNTAFPPCIYKINPIELQEIKKYAVT